MKAFDPALASPFHMEWLVPLDEVSEDDYTRAVAEKASQLLRSARFIEMAHNAEGTDTEVRVWVEAACGPACVSITWEPGVQRFGFHLLDETCRERLGCVVFEEVPCVDAGQSEAQADAVLDAAIRALHEAERRDDLQKLAERVRHAEKSVRVPVSEEDAFDPGVEP